MISLVTTTHMSIKIIVFLLLCIAVISNAFHSRSFVSSQSRASPGYAAMNSDDDLTPSNPRQRVAQAFADKLRGVVASSAAIYAASATRASIPSAVAGELDHIHIQLIMSLISLVQALYRMQMLSLAATASHRLYSSPQISHPSSQR